MVKRLGGTQVKTNDVGFRFAAQEELGVIPATGWEELEMRSITSFGAEIEKNTRTTLGQDRGASKPSIVGLTAPFEYEADITVSGMRKFIPGFCYAKNINGDVTELPVANISGADTINLPTPLTADQAPKFRQNALVWLSGASVSVNNGLKRIDTAAAANNSALDVGSGLQPDSSPRIRASFAGYRRPSGSGLTFAYTDITKKLTIGFTGAGTTLRALGLTEGQRVHIGSPNDAGTEYQNAPSSAGKVMYGTARVLMITDGSVMFDQVSERLKAAPSALTGVTLDILFGEFIRNVRFNHDDYCEYAYVFEQEIRGLGDGSGSNTLPSYEYTLDQYPNQLSIDLPLKDDARVTFGFSGSDVLVPTTVRRPGPDNAVRPFKSAAFSTSADIARLTVDDVDDNGLTTDFETARFNLNNNVAPKYVLAHLGPKFQNVGALDVSMEATLLFTSPLVLAAIRRNDTVGYSTHLGNDEGNIFFDIPSATMSGGSRSYPENDSVSISVGIDAHKDDRFDSASVMFSTIPVRLPNFDLQSSI